MRGYFLIRFKVIYRGKFERLRDFTVGYINVFCFTWGIKNCYTYFIPLLVKVIEKYGDEVSKKDARKYVLRNSKVVETTIKQGYLSWKTVDSQKGLRRQGK